MVMQPEQVPVRIPVRVDLAGGWLDVPKLARPGGYIVNCAISPTVTKDEWPYAKNAGIGGSAAWALLNGKNPVEAELEAGVGWQDPAIIMETGLCVWASGPQPKLVCKWDPEALLGGRLALYYTGGSHVTANLVDAKRDYDAILEAGKVGHMAVQSQSVMVLRRTIHLSYEAQLAEGMKPLPEIQGTVCKYCGSGWGGYALYYFQDSKTRDAYASIEADGWMAVEPFFAHRWE